MNDKTYTVYRHITPNGKMYVGVTSRELNKRWQDGKGYHHNKYFTNAINKYGWDNIRHEILLEGLTKEEASLAERLFIGYWDLTNQNKGYNIEEGGVVGGKLTQEIKDKISKSLTGKPKSKETRQKMSDAQKRREYPRGRDHHMYGKKASEATRRKLSSAQKGKRLSEQHKENISKSLMGSNNPNYGKEGKKHYSSIPLTCLDTGVIYHSLSDVVRLLGYLRGINAPNVSACCRGKQRTAGGYKWKYLEDINL